MENIDLIKVTLDNIGQLQIIGCQTFYDTFPTGNTEENLIKYVNEGFSIEKLIMETLANVHPGEILLEEFLKPM